MVSIGPGEYWRPEIDPLLLLDSPVPKDLRQKFLAILAIKNRLNRDYHDIANKEALWFQRISRWYSTFYGDKAGQLNTEEEDANAYRRRNARNQRRRLGRCCQGISMLSRNSFGGVAAVAGGTVLPIHTIRLAKLEERWKRCSKLRGQTRILVFRIRVCPTA